MSEDYEFYYSFETWADFLEGLMNDGIEYMLDYTIGDSYERIAPDQPVGAAEAMRTIAKNLRFLEGDSYA